MTAEGRSRRRLIVAGTTGSRDGRSEGEPWHYLDRTYVTENTPRIRIHSIMKQKHAFFNYESRKLSVLPFATLSIEWKTYGEKRT